MIITCPNCGTHYDVSPHAIKPTGTMIRCSQCEYAWQQSIMHSVEVREQQVTFPAPVQVSPAPAPLVETPPPAPVPAPAPIIEPEPTPEPTPEPAPAPEPAPEPEPTPPENDVSMDDIDDVVSEDDTEIEPMGSMVGDNIDEDQAEVIDVGDLIGDDEDPIPEGLTQPSPYPDDEAPVGRARFKKPPAKKKGNGLKITLMVLALLIIGAGASIVLAKKKIIEIYPPAKALYMKAGMYHPDPGEGLAQRDVKPRRDVRNGVELLIVEGKVVNITKHDIKVPPMQVSLTNTQDKTVASQIIELIKPVIKPGETLPFKAEFEHPPGTARKMSVKFINPKAPQDGARGGGDQTAPAEPAPAAH